MQKELDRVVAQMSTWDADSDLSRFNHAPTGTWHVLPEEFFAVASEGFFVTPQALKAEQPALYRLLASYYRQDPA